jgi:phosphate/sulfate permease
MPTAPIIIPVIIAGITLGSLLVTENHKITKKKILAVSLISGLLNTANAYLVYTLFPPPTFSRITGGTFAGGGFAAGGSTAFQLRAAGSSVTSFLALSFITGFLVVLAIVGIALFYARRKSGQTEEEETKESKEEETEETKLEDEDT